MKFLAAVGVALLTVLSIPFMAIPGGNPDQPAGSACGNIEVILETIRNLESSDDYQAQSPNSTASGAYQFIDSVWRNLAGPLLAARYPTAATAPADLQDRVAAGYVTDILDNHDNQVAVVPIIWYLPAALDNDTLMDQVPAGNVYTPRQYQRRWLETYQHKTGPVDAAACADSQPAHGGWALPVAAEQLTDATIAAPHHDYPAWDLMLPVGTPIYAITSGQVVNTQHWDGNWWTAGCSTSEVNGCNTCGNGITIHTSDGLRHTYCHNSRLHVADGDHIQPGQHIADSGDTGRSGAPHLHLELRLNDIQRCPQPLLAALYHQQPPPGPAALPTSGCSF